MNRKQRLEKKKKQKEFQKQRREAKKQQLKKQLPAVVTNKTYEQVPKYIDDVLEELEQEFTGRWDDKFMFADTFRNSGSPMQEFKKLFTEIKKNEAMTSVEFIDKMGKMKTFLDSDKYEEFLDNERNIKDLIKAHKYDETLTREEYKQVNAAYKIMRELYDLRTLHTENQEYLLKRRKAEDKLLEYLWINDIQEFGVKEVLNLKDYKDTFYNLMSATSAILNISSSSVLSEFKKNGLMAGFSKYAKQIFDKGRESGDANLLSAAASHKRASSSTVKLIMNTVHRIQKERKEKEDVTVDKKKTMQWNPWSDAPSPGLIENIAQSMYEGEYDSYDDTGF